MLQLWVPRTPELDTALLDGVRSLIPHQFDSASEEVSLRILRALARFEDVDDLPDETVAHLLIDKELRRRLGAEPEVAAQIQLVRDAIVEEVGTTKIALERAQSEKAALEREVDSLRADGLQRETRAVEKQKEAAARAEALQGELAAVGAKAKQFEERIGSLEQALASGTVAESRRRAVAIAAVAALGLGAAGWLLGPILAKVLPFAVGRSRALLEIGFGIAWLVGLRLVGRRTESVRTWPLFTAFERVHGWVMLLLGAVLVELVTGFVMKLFQK